MAMKQPYAQAKYQKDVQVTDKLIQVSQVQSGDACALPDWTCETWIMFFTGSRDRGLSQHFLTVHDIDALGLRAKASRRSCTATVEMIDGCYRFSFDGDCRDAAQHILFHDFVGVPRVNGIVC